MNAVGLNRAGHIHKIPVDHGHDGGAVFGGEIAKYLVELMNIVGAVVRRKGDAGEENPDVRVFERHDHGIEVVSSLTERQAAKAVVAAKLNDDDCGVQGDDGVEAGNSVFTGGAARALVENLVAIAEFVEVSLESVRVRLTGGETIACRDAVAVADQERAISGK